MKIILTGNTGLIGAEVLTQCLADPAITSIFALSRRELPIQHPKLKQIQHSDFTSYPPALLTQLQGADACIWSLGIAIPKVPEDMQRINQDFPLAAAKALAANRDGKPFRFVYVSGVLVEKDQQRKLWMLSEGRKLRGRTELELLKLDGDGNEMHIARPGFVGTKDGSVKDTVLGLLLPTIRVDALAAALIDTAVNGGEGPMHENDEMMQTGKAIRSVS